MNSFVGGGGWVGGDAEVACGEKLVFECAPRRRILRRIGITRIWSSTWFRFPFGAGLHFFSVFVFWFLLIASLTHLFPFHNIIFHLPNNNNWAWATHAFITLILHVSFSFYSFKFSIKLHILYTAYLHKPYLLLNHFIFTI